MARVSFTAKIPNPLRLYLLGTFQAERDNRTSHLPTRKVESLLAFLALYSEPHTREKLAALLWGNSTDEQARHSLRTALVAIRKELGDNILLADRETVQLNPDFPLWVDVRELEEMANVATVESTPPTLQIAIDLYRGDLLSDFYDDWIVQERERLRALYLDALLQLAQQARSQTQYERAIGFAQQVLASDRASEKAYQHIIFCLAATGDRIGALRQYDKCKQQLRAELGVEPSPETLALRDQIEQALTGSKSREAFFTNLPHPLTSFIGRAKEVPQLSELIRNTRLLTMTGAGGSGKTRLAIQVATALATANHFQRGVWWVELAPLSDPALVPQAVANVFELPESPGVLITNTLTSYFRNKHLLLVLDNCEHLVEACARLAEMLLRACPELRILATSQEALRISGETVFQIPTLSVPELRVTPARVDLERNESVQLFVARAQAIKTDFVLTAQNAPAIVQICQRLDGIPLALELAAARVKALSVEEIAERLDDRFRLLTGGSRTALPRHQTLRSMIDWSYALLSEPERVLFRRLAVFAGGWTLEAAEEICPDGAEAIRQSSLQQSDVLDLLTQLMDKSLVALDERGSKTRYHLPETIRQYARDKLLESGEIERICKKHLAFFVELADAAEPEFQGIEPKRWVERLEAEQDNFRAALEWSLGNDAEAGLQLAGALGRFWQLRVFWNEGRNWLSRFLSLPGSQSRTRARARALKYAGIFVRFTPSDILTSRAWFEESLAIYRELGDKSDVASLLGHLALSARDHNDWTMARNLAEECLIIYQMLEDKQGIASLLDFLGQLALLQGDREQARTLFTQSLQIIREAGLQGRVPYHLGSLGILAAFYDGNLSLGRALFEESLAIYREMGNRLNYSWTLRNLAEVAIRQGDYEIAHSHLEECLGIDKLAAKWELGRDYQVLARLARSQGNDELLDDLYQKSLNLLKDESESDVAYTLEGMASMALKRGKADRAIRLFGAAAAIRDRIAVPMRPVDRADYEGDLAGSRATVGDNAFTSAWAKGRAMGLQQAVEYALKEVKDR